jgi:hypothetical protein
MLRDILSPTLKPTVKAPQGYKSLAFPFAEVGCPGAHTPPTVGNCGGRVTQGILFFSTLVEISSKYVAEPKRIPTDTPKRRKREPTIEITNDEWGLIRRQNSLLRDIMERYAHDSENSRALYERFITFDRRIKKVLDELAERMERIERLELLDKTGHLAEAREIRSEIKQELGSLEWQLARRLKNLQYLQEQAATYGAGRVDLDLINQISDETEAVQLLQLKLKEQK